RKVIAFGIMMITNNQRCNALQRFVGIFLHSCNAPQALVEWISRIGLSTSVTSINRSLNSLSRDTRTYIIQISKLLTTAIVDDNLDFELKHAIPTLEKSVSDTLHHVTTGFLLPLTSITRVDLECADVLWER
ncbi:hypothetical protein BDN72DRAFT_751699, partial [Pluteus cervinus]